MGGKVQGHAVARMPCTAHARAALERSLSRASPPPPLPPLQMVQQEQQAATAAAAAAEALAASLQQQLDDKAAAHAAALAEAKTAAGELVALRAQLAEAAAAQEQLGGEAAALQQQMEAAAASHAQVRAGRGGLARSCWSCWPQPHLSLLSINIKAPAQFPTYPPKPFQELAVLSDENISLMELLEGKQVRLRLACGWRARGWRTHGWGAQRTMACSCGSA